MDKTYSEIRFIKLPRLKVAKYTAISPNPENDAHEYMENWGKESGLADLKDYKSRIFGCDAELSKIDTETNPDFRGYSLYVTIPEDFTPQNNRAEILYIEADEYATLRITDPFSDPFGKIPPGWQKLFDYVLNSEYKPENRENRYCFEEIIEMDGTTYMDVYAPIK